MSDDNESTYKTIGTMDQLNPQDVQNYWGQVEDILKGAFKVSENDARAYIGEIQERLRASPPDTQLHFYHANPFQVAIDLTKRNGPIAVEAKEYYINHVRKLPENDRPSRESLQRLLPDDLISRPRPS
jgi:hypothetical protein